MKKTTATEEKTLRCDNCNERDIYQCDNCGTYIGVNEVDTFLCLDTPGAIRHICHECASNKPYVKSTEDTE